MTTTSRNMRLERMGADLESFEENAKLARFAAIAYDRHWRGGIGRGDIDDELVEVLAIIFQKLKRGEAVTESTVKEIVEGI